MKKLLLTVFSLTLLCLAGETLPTIAAQLCNEDAAVIPIQKTTNEFSSAVAVVRNKRDLQRLSGQNVILIGRYQRVIPDKPLMMGPLEFMTEVPGELVPIDPKLDLNNIPTIPLNKGFANILLEDGWSVPISPRGRRSLRFEDELIKYDGQVVRGQGRVNWWGGTILSLASGIDIEQLQFACNAPKPQKNIASSTLLPTVSRNFSAPELKQQSILGRLGYPLGKIVTVSGQVRQSDWALAENVLRVESVNDRPLPQPITIEFNLFKTAQVAEPILGRSFKYVGYETGGFTGVPPEAFKYVPAVATTDHRFNTSFQVLREELDTVKTKSDLVRFDGRRVQVIGKYVSKSQKPLPSNTGIPGFEGTYIRARIVLEDGTEVPIFPGYDKSSLRSPQEARTYEGKVVKVVGKIEIQRNLELNLSQRSTFASFDGIWLYQPL